MSNFPTTMYRVPGPHKKPRGGAYAYRGASDQAEFDALIAKGWFPSYEEAVAGKAAPKVVEQPIDEVSGPTRDELESKAKELGVSFNARTSDKKLAERIAVALEG
jgi:hypothetical protein